MVSPKSLLAGILIVAAIVVLSERTQAGAIIAAGSSGTMYIGGHSRSLASNPTYSAPASWTGYAAPVAPSAPASVPPSPVPVAPPAPPVSSPPPQMSLSFPPVTPTPTTAYDAFINFGSAPYADQTLLTTGNAQPWYSSASVLKAFGHAPSGQEMNDFSQTVLSRVESTFANSGLTIQATTDPNARGAHMLSVVSGLSAASNANAVGITSVGRNGFDLIDKLGYANSADELAWAVAHNVAHELMHSFGGSHHFTPDGKNLDAPISDWSILTDPNTVFSAESVAEMTYNLRQGGLGMRYGAGAQMLDADGQELLIQPVPEPATMALWGAMAGLVGWIRSRSKHAA